MSSNQTKQVTRALLTTLAAAFALSLVACGERHPQPSPERFGKNVTPDTRAGSAESTAERAADAAEKRMEQAGKALDDAAVTAKVKSALIAEPHLKALSINVDTTAGIVTLKGTADSHEAKQKAEQAAATVEGVRSVRNELVVVRG